MCLKTSFEQHSVIGNNYEIHPVLLIQSMTDSLQTESKIRNPYSSTFSSNLVTGQVSELLQVTLSFKIRHGRERARGKISGLNQRQWKLSWEEARGFSAIFLSVKFFYRK